MTEIYVAVIKDDAEEFILASPTGDNSIEAARKSADHWRSLGWESMVAAVTPLDAKVLGFMNTNKENH